MRWGFVLGIMVALFAAETHAGSVLIYDGRGKLETVIRPSPSGVVVYDGRGNIENVVRQTGFGRRTIIDPGLTGVRILGTGLSSDVSGLRGGVGFN